MKQALPRNNFSSGIISQQLSGRIDLPAFSNGLKNLENFDINLNGSLSKRTGFELNNKNETTGDSFFMKFVFNQAQAYILEFKPDNKFRVWYEPVKDKLRVYTKNDDVVWFDYPFDFKLLPEVKTTQSFDTIYFCHKSFHPKVLKRGYDRTNKVLSFTFKDVEIKTKKLSSETAEEEAERENPFNKDGNPGCCCFYQGRIFYAGFKNQVNKIWASDKGYMDFFTTKRNHRSDILDIDGFNFELSEIHMPILWMRDTPIGLILGTAQGIAIIKSSSGQITPFNFSCNTINRDSASIQDPIIVGNSIIYVDSTLKRLKALTFSFDVNGFINTNLNIMCPELLQEPIKKICYQEDEKDFIYVLTESGFLYYLLYSANEMFFAWAKIKTYDKIKHIETLEKRDSGTNLFIIDSKNNILRKTDTVILRSIEDFYSVSRNSSELHNIYYLYLKCIVNKFNFLDYSTQISYLNDRRLRQRLVFTRTEENERGIFGELQGYTITEEEEENEGLYRTSRNSRFILSTLAVLFVAVGASLIINGFRKWFASLASLFRDPNSDSLDPDFDPSTFDPDPLDTNIDPEKIFPEPEEVLKNWLIEDRDTFTLFEVIRKIDDATLEVRVLSKIDNDTDITIPERNIIDTDPMLVYLKTFIFDENRVIRNWSYNKNVLDNIPIDKYPVGSKWTIVGDGYHFNNQKVEPVTITETNENGELVERIVGGKIKLPDGMYIGCFKIGHNYTSYLKTMNLGGMIDNMNTMISKKNISKVYARLYNSWGGKFGTDFFDLKEIGKLSLENYRYNEPHTIQDLDVKLDVTDKWEFNKNYYIVHDTPFPFNINSITILADYNN